MKFVIKKTGDTITLNLWLYLQKVLGNVVETAPFYSNVYHFPFFSMSEYWMEMGKREILTSFIANKPRPYIGVSYKEIVERATSSLLGLSPGVVLFNINTYQLGKLKDRLMDNEKVIEEDFVVIFAKSKEAARKILDKIPSQMAEGYAMDRGRFFYDNFEES